MLSEVTERKRSIEKINHWLGEPKVWFGPNDSENRFIYVTLTSGGIKEEGAMPRLYDSPVAALDAYADALEEYISGASDVVWRATPEVRCSGLGFYVWSRLYAKRLVE